MPKFQVRFQVTASPSSREGVLLDYLLARETPYPLRDMVMLAVQSFWLPLAYRDRQATSLPPPELEQLVRSCVLRLQMQQQYLQALLPKPLAEFPEAPVERKPLLTIGGTSVGTDVADEREAVWDPFA
ncbi:MAG: hypothetical protein AB4040_16405 [Synechococcus sp.]